MNVLNEKWELSQQAFEFFVYTTLGIVPDRLFNDGEKYQKWIENNTSIENLSDECQNALFEKFNYTFYCAFMCAKAAYNDLCRTLTYQEKYKGEEANNDVIEGKRKAVNAICLEIATKACTNKEPEIIFTVFGEFKDENDTKPKPFKINDDLDLIQTYLEKGENNLKFHFGQVQKWVNMTLKYLYLLGLVKEENAKELHIPIDSYIIEALWYKDRNITIPKTQKKKDGELLFSEEKYKDHRNNYKYSDEKVKSWSLWDYENDYYPLGLPTGLDLQWEHKAWIAVAEKRKGVFDAEELEQILQK